MLLCRVIIVVLTRCPKVSPARMLCKRTFVAIIRIQRPSPKLAKFNLWLIKRRTKSVDQPIERDTYTRGSNNCSSVVAMRSVEVQVVECQQQDLFCFKGTACTIASAALLAESCHTSRPRIDNTTEPICAAAASLPVGCRCWVRS